MLAADHRRFVWAIILVRGAATAYPSLFVADLLGSTMLLWSLLPVRERTVERCAVSSPSLDLEAGDLCLGRRGALQTSAELGWQTGPEHPVIEPTIAAEWPFGV